MSKARDDHRKDVRFWFALHRKDGSPVGDHVCTPEEIEGLRRRAQQRLDSGWVIR